MTVMPTSLLRAIDATQTLREIACGAYDGHTRRLPVFIVEIAIVDARWGEGVPGRFEALDVLGVDGQAEVLLGRDVLAAWNLHLDGPNARYSVS